MKLKISPMMIAVSLAVFAGLLSLLIGSVGIPLKTLFRMLVDKLPGVHITSDWPASYETILFDLRFPRTALIALTGASLAGSGAAYQGLFRNPLADPYLIGVASGAGLGAVIAMSVHWPEKLARILCHPVCGFSRRVTDCFDRIYPGQGGKVCADHQPVTRRGLNQQFLYRVDFLPDDPITKRTSAGDHLAPRRVIDDRLGTFSGHAAICNYRVGSHTSVFLSFERIAVRRRAGCPIGGGYQKSQGGYHHRFVPCSSIRGGIYRHHWFHRVDRAAHGAHNLGAGLSKADPTLHRVWYLCPSGHRYYRQDPHPTAGSAIGNHNRIGRCAIFPVGFEEI